MTKQQITKIPITINRLIKDLCRFPILEEISTELGIDIFKDGKQLRQIMRSIKNQESMKASLKALDKRIIKYDKASDCLDRLYDGCRHNPNLTQNLPLLEKDYNTVVNRLIDYLYNEKHEYTNK